MSFLKVGKQPGKASSTVAESTHEAIGESSSPTIEEVVKTIPPGSMNEKAKAEFDLNRALREEDHTTTSDMHVAVRYSLKPYGWY